jgi:UrcA family protein
MTTLLKAFSVAAGAAIAALSIAATAQAEPVRIPVDDLNLNTDQGQAQFNRRVEHAARVMCDDQADLRSNMACRQAVRDEAKDNLRDQQEQVAKGSTNVNVATAGRR